jgi:Protein of unknown function (DUF2628)
VVTYTVHEREDETGEITERADGIVFVKEGFAWLALLMPILWLLYHRLWLALIGFIALIIALQATFTAAQIADDVSGWVFLALSAMFALLANDVRRWTLDMRGFRLVEPVSGRDLAECEERFFTDWLAAQGAGLDDLPGTVKSTLKPSPAPAGPVKDSTSTEDVIGLFPEPGR